MCPRYLQSSSTPCGPKPWLILHFSVLHLSLWGSCWLNFLWASKCSWQKVCWHAWHMWKSTMQFFSLHERFPHIWHLMLWVLHANFLHLRHEATELQLSQIIVLQILHRFGRISSRGINKLQLQLLQSDLIMLFSCVRSLPLISIHHRISG
jgi:hypothetical protein